MPKKIILVTGSNGFIARNILLHLSEDPDIETICFTRNDSIDELPAIIASVDIVLHLAGENRPKNPIDFTTNNVELTSAICNAIKNTNRNIPLIFASSIQAENDSDYGKSKLAAEKIIEALVSETNNSAIIYRLVGIFGKYAKPNYNSVVATFCHNIARGYPIQINDPHYELQLGYIDDVIEEFLSYINFVKPGLTWGSIKTIYSITLGDLAKKINNFKNSRTNLIIERVGSGLTHALYSTYISYIPNKKFIYDLLKHEDERGIFVEMLKTIDSGQFSFLTVNPKMTRGSHYHHTKTEKFLVVSGKVKMRYRNLITGEIHEFILCSKKPQVIDTIPGWVHDITNIGKEVAIIILWANEIFNPDNPDCFHCEV